MTFRNTMKSHFFLLFPPLQSVFLAQHRPNHWNPPFPVSGLSSPQRRTFFWNVYLSGWSPQGAADWRPGGERPLLSGSQLQQHPIASASRPGLEPQLRGARAGGGCISRGTVAVPASCNCVRSECWCSPHSSRGNPTPAGDGIRRLRGPGGVCHEDVTQEEMPCEEIPGPCSAGRAEASAAWKRPVTWPCWLPDRGLPASRTVRS